MFMILALVIVVLIAGVLVAAAMRPSHFRVQRAASIAATPQKIVAQLDDFHAWAQWSPWEKMDPTMTRTYEDTSKGVGAVYGWAGTGKVGTGRMEVLDVAPARVVIKLDFLKPFEAHNTAIFTLEPQADGTTRLVWTMEGPQPYIGKLMGMIFNMDKMIGPDFEVGLANLKLVVEA